MVVYTHAGPEISVASTKAYMVQISVMYLLAFELAYGTGRISKEQCEKYTKGTSKYSFGYQRGNRS